jgi:alginate O-acetyltransferase complex protein AlgI
VTSYLAFALFVPISAIVYWRLPRSATVRAWFLFGISAALLATLELRAVVALASISLVTFGCLATAGLKRRPVSVALVVFALSFLGYYKYFPPLIAIFRRTGPEALGDVVVPLGASYFTFKLIHYIVERARDRLPPHGLGEFLAWVFFFPMFTAGPIERFEEFQSNRAPKFTHDHLLGAITRIGYGVIKKFVFVKLLLERDVLHDPRELHQAVPIFYPAFKAADFIRMMPRLNAAFAWQYVVNHFVAAYLDFSAYNDIAIGIALLFGIRLVENFDYPILAPNIGEFWKRWHISLSNWCQRYVYMPSMALTRRPYVAIYATMMVMSLWHEGSLGYVYRGLYHGTLLALFVTWGRVRRRMKWKPWNGALVMWSCRGLTFFAASAAGAFTALDADASTGLRLFALLFGFHFGKSSG